MSEYLLLKEKKDELLKWIKTLGLTNNIFAERVFYYMNDSDNEKEVKKFQSKFNKLLQRDTTKIELIKTYLDILYEQEEFKKLGYVKPKNYFNDEFDNIFNKKMKKISQLITEEISYNEDIN
jgi:hypothetical protein